MDTTTILSSTIGALVGGAIGTYLGAYFLRKFSEKKIEKVRDIACKALNLFIKYAKNNNTYKECISDFNITFNIAEKRAILVCLYKLGIPISLPIGTNFNLKNVNFIDATIDKGEIDDMITQIEKGHCDHLFFMDVENVFNENILQKTIRNIGIKYIEKVLKGAKMNNNNSISLPEEKLKTFSFSEIKTLLVFINQTKDNLLFKQNGEPDIEKLDQLINDVKIGLWDGYLLWNYDAYQNMMAQKEIVSYLTSQPTLLRQNPNI